MMKRILAWRSEAKTFQGQVGAVDPPAFGSSASNNLRTRGSEKG